MSQPDPHNRTDPVHPLRPFRTIGKICILGACLMTMVIIPAAADALDGPVASDYPRIFRFGVLNLLAGVNLDDAKVAIEMNIVKRNRVQFPELSAKIELLKDVASAYTLLKEKRLHAISLSGSDFLNLKERVPIEPLFISTQQNAPVEAYVLLTLNSVESFDQLLKPSRRRLVIEDYGQAHIGQLWLDTVLWDRGYQSSQYAFTTIRRADKPARMVLPVFFGQAEACLVPESAYETMVELNPQIGKRLRVLMRSPGFVRAVTCARQDLNFQLVEALKRNAVNMPYSVDGKQLMLIFRYKRHFLFDPEYMKETQRVYRLYHSEAARR